MVKKYVCPKPIVNKKESASLDRLTEKYKKLLEPSKAAKAVNNAGKLVPAKVKKAGVALGNKITQQELYQKAMEIISSGFKVVEEQVSKYTISTGMIIKNVNKSISNADIETIEELCLLRSYDISKIVNKNKGMSRLYAGLEGAVTGSFGFKGLPFNLVLSLLLYFRAVQTIAMYYGYDIKNNEDELIIASDVFTNALSPGKNDANNELGGAISKVMLLTEASVVKQTAKKTWTEMAKHGGIPLLLAQMRALANKSAQKALENAGKKGLEQSIFKDVFEQIGKKLTLETVSKSVPIVSGAIGALIDISQMNTVVKYADIFYQKRFILEKQHRIDLLINDEAEIIDAEFEEKCL